MSKLEWILIPGALYLLLALGIGLCLCLFFSLKAEIGALESRRKRNGVELAEAISAVRSAVDGVRAEVREMAEQTGMLVAPVPAKSGLNLSKRGQVLQMSRRGQSPEEIAATLGLPRTEIDLLIKVHQIVLEQVG